MSQERRVRGADCGLGWGELQVVCAEALEKLADVTDVLFRGNVEDDNIIQVGFDASESLDDTR